MAQYTTETFWLRGDQDFLGNRYSRRHTLRFDAGFDVPGSSSPHVVPIPYSDASAIDPEEMFISSLSSCHMLWFLSIAAKHKYIVDSYKDIAIGILQKGAQGKMAMSVVTLRPEVRFSGNKIPSRAELDQMHHEAHEECFIANSVKTEVRCEPVYEQIEAASL